MEKSLKIKTRKLKVRKKLSIILSFNKKLKKKKKLSNLSVYLHASAHSVFGTHITLGSDGLSGITNPNGQVMVLNMYDKIISFYAFAWVWYGSQLWWNIFVFANVIYMQIF